MVESLTVELGPVTDSSAKTASVDVVKRRVVGPFGFGVVDFELDIRWYPVFCQALSIGKLATARFGSPAGLYGRQIRPNDFGARVLTGNALDQLMRNGSPAEFARLTLRTRSPRCQYRCQYP